MAIEHHRNPGAMSYVDVPYQSVYASTPISASFWVYITELASTSGGSIGFFRQWHGSDPWASWIFYSWNGNDILTLRVTSSSGTPYYLGSTVMSTGIWYHAVMTVSSGLYVRLYINGAQQATKSMSSWYAATGQLALGGGWDNGEGMKGTVADLRIYNRELSAGEVQTIHACRGNDGIIHGLVSRWLGNEGAVGSSISGSNIIKDIATGGHHATPHNSPKYTIDQLNFGRFNNG